MTPWVATKNLARVFLKFIWAWVKVIAFILLVGVIGVLLIAGAAWLAGAVAHEIVNLVLDGWNNS